MALARIPGVERGLLEDIEPGALVYSRTRTYGNNLPVGGVVAEIIGHDHATGEALDDPTVLLIRWNYHPTSPYLYDLTLSDIDAATATFFSRACDIEAQNIDRYLSTLKTQHQRAEAITWRRLGASLALLAAMGPYTPRAMQRERDVFEGAKRRAATATSEREDQARADELMPKLEAAIAEARARRNTPAV